MRDYHIKKGGSCSQSLQLGDFRQAFMPHLTVDGATSVQEVSSGNSLFGGGKNYIVEILYGGKEIVYLKISCNLHQMVLHSSVVSTLEPNAPLYVVG